MPDLSGIDSSQSVKIVGNDLTGLEQVPVESAIDNEGKGRLLVQAKVVSGELVPTITNKFRIQYGIADVDLSTVGTFETLYTRSGKGLFFGFQAAFNGSNVAVRLQIDGASVFSISLDDVRAFQFNDTSSTRMQLGGFLTTSGNIFDFSSKFAIPYGTSVTVSAARLSGGNVKNTNWILFQTEDA